MADATANESWRRGVIAAWEKVLDWMMRLGRHEFALLVIVAVLSACLWGFVEIADEVVEGETHEFDRRILLAMRNPIDLSDAIGPPWFEELARDVTALGGPAMLTLTTLAVAGLLALQRKLRTVLVLLVSVVGGMAVSLMLKAVFGRTRPDLVPHMAQEASLSFPSAHSMMAAVVYLTLGAMLARVMTLYRVKAYVLVLAVLITLAIGVTRVYMGVHWPTDVVAGWAVGAAWAALCWAIVRTLQRRGQTESDRIEPERPGHQADATASH